jgi:protein-arginine deiminase
MRIFNARPWGRESSLDYVPIKWILGDPAKGREPSALRQDVGGVAFYNPEHEGKGHTQDSHGNHDLVPPYEGFPMGRIIHGNKVWPETQAFYNAQGVQGPAIVLDTTWLAVEHVDEFFHWVPAATPRGWKLLYASPALMLEMLEKLSADGQGAAMLHAGKGAFAMTVDEALADTDLNEWSQLAEVKIQGHIDIMKAETGLTDDEIVAIPTWFEELGSNEKVAWNPGMVNMRILGNVASIAKPFGPKIDGKDPFEEDILARLGSPMNGIGRDGQGLEVHFTDDWYYHVALGEVHCGTNETAPVYQQEGFAWWESGK